LRERERGQEREREIQGRKRDPGGEREGGTQEREKRGKGAAPPLVPAHSTTGWGCPAWPPAKWRRRAAPATGRGRRGRLPPQQNHRRGLLPPPAKRKREGACPPLKPSTGAQVGPWLPAAAGHCRRRPRPGVAPATPKRKGGKWESWFWVFVVVMDLVNLWLIGGVVEELEVMGGRRGVG